MRKPVKKSSGEECLMYLKESLAGVSIKLLSNGPFKPLIQQRGDKIYFTDNKNSSLVDERDEARFVSNTATDYLSSLHPLSIGSFVKKTSNNLGVSLKRTVYGYSLYK